MKKITTLILLCSLAIFAKDYSVTIKAKGKFGEDLKALIEKYQKTGNIEVIEKAPAKKETLKEQIANFFTEKKKEENYKQKISNIKLGKKIYNSQCVSCHGQRGEKLAYGQKKPLSQMTQNEYLDAMSAYNTVDSDDEEINNQSLQMTQYANSVTYDQNIAIYQYLQSLNNPKANTK